MKITLTVAVPPKGGLIVSQRAMHALEISHLNASSRRFVCPFGFSDETRPTDINVTLVNRTKKA